ADCVILRQVLQHLSNDEIGGIIEKLIKYKYIILTEHLPTGRFTPNRNVISGQAIRLKQDSGVDLLEPPFNLNIITEYKCDDLILPNNKGRIVTSIYKCY
ncbi:MAG: SAM-dependent methyltransferase, partial [Winogradskyella sp.]|nr:SAM-dependent methyltransferase [Winogradskyella sp.]